jgi:HSP20 family protein
MNWERPFGINVRKNSGQQLIPSFSALQDEMNRLFEHFYKGSELYLTKWEKEMSLMAPAINVIENGDSFRVEAELPGIPPEAVEVSVTSGYLIVKGEKKEEKEEKDVNYIRHESSYGSFYRQVALPETANFDKAEASFKNGILTVKVPKKAEAVVQPKILQIKKVA